ncbi:hypothetical protein CVT25_010108 [Psilocybe cyanescens]|uniref:Uncharacterized protein n=1 Tax=Psilocybe cyanescens TaxID=93625 RepID=A0A409XJ31_PSICY|nr:hypothetical protein CVT25_010108 [Psilocybe cyanescens]
MLLPSSVFFLDDNNAGPVEAPESTVEEVKTYYIEQHMAGEDVLTPDFAVDCPPVGPPGAIPAIIAALQILPQVAIIHAHAHQAVQNNVGPNSQSQHPSKATTHVLRKRLKPVAVRVHGFQYTIENNSNWEPLESIRLSLKSFPKKTLPFFLFIPPPSSHFSTQPSSFQASLPEEITSSEDNSSPLRHSKHIALQVVDLAPNRNPGPSMLPSCSSHSLLSSSSPSDSSSFSLSLSSRLPLLSHISHAN